MSMELIYEIPVGSEGPQHMPVHRLLFHQPGLMVNLQGERFINEGIMGNTTFTGNAINRQKERCAFIIFDEATLEYYENHGLDMVAPHIRVMYVEDIAEDIRKSVAGGNEHAFVADSLEELAAQTGIDRDGLLATVAEYNQACTAGRDGLFHKDYRYLRPVAGPRFYAGRLLPSGYGSLGGIKINYRTEVLDEDRQAIPGLYAAGTDANSIYGDSYVFVLPGNTMGFAVNSGRIAGENAAAYARS
jgi:fumarate reductase flavoprotein subunit